MSIVPHPNRQHRAIAKRMELRIKTKKAKAEHEELSCMFEKAKYQYDRERADNGIRFQLDYVRSMQNAVSFLAPVLAPSEPMQPEPQKPWWKRLFDRLPREF